MTKTESKTPNGGGTWPEQNAVDAWLKKHGIQVTFDQALELKEAATEYRLTREAVIAECHLENAALRSDIERHIKIAADLAAEAEQLRERLGKAEHQRDGLMKEQVEVEQILGKALGYPWFKDDQKNFPGATEKDGVCVGDHVPASLAQEAATRLAKAERDAERLDWLESYAGADALWRQNLPITRERIDQARKK